VIQRQYTGTADRIENAQVAVYLVYAGLRRHAAVDREHDIPRSWTCDPDRCRAAGLGEETSFATKPELAARMIGQFLDAGHRVGWVAGDEVYGGTPKLRAALEERQVGYVLAYDWAVIDLAEVRPGSHRLLIRRNRTTGELAYYRCFSPTPVPMAASPGREETVRAGKGLAGLDEHQLRRFTSWVRWVTLAMLAHAFLAVVRADEYAHHPTPDGLIPLTCNEIQ
jgi:SRSO17 transposase